MVEMDEEKEEKKQRKGIIGVAIIPFLCSGRVKGIFSAGFCVWEDVRHLCGCVQGQKKLSGQLATKFG
jgi:hypothetical protein